MIFSLFVGYTEESVFRGIIKERLQMKGPVFYIVFSSIFFGILHMANAFNGEDILQTVSQVINAFLIGIILALLIELTQNIIPLIAFHFLYDALALMTNPDNVDKELLVLFILNILYLVYGIYLVYVLTRKREVTIDI
ncbi:CAAX amino terminal protease self- immunity [compost metagenome]